MKNEMLPVWVRIEEKNGVFRCISKTVPPIYADSLSAQGAMKNFIEKFKNNHGLDCLPVLQGGAE